MSIYLTKFILYCLEYFRISSVYFMHFFFKCIRECVFRVFLVDSIRSPDKTHMYYENRYYLYFFLCFESLWEFATISGVLGVAIPAVCIVPLSFFLFFTSVYIFLLYTEYIIIFRIHILTSGKFATLCSEYYTIGELRSHCWITYYYYYT